MTRSQVQVLISPPVRRPRVVFFVFWHKKSPGSIHTGGVVKSGFDVQPRCHDGLGSGVGGTGIGSAGAGLGSRNGYGGAGVGVTVGIDHNLALTRTLFPSLAIALSEAGAMFSTGAIASATAVTTSVVSVVSAVVSVTSVVVSAVVSSVVEAGASTNSFSESSCHQDH